MNQEKEKALQAAMAQIEKQFGKGSVMRMDQQEGPVDVPVISTGSLGLDTALGIGGLPRGRIVEIYGPESSGKTTLALQVVAECHKKRAAAPLSWMRSMLWIFAMLRSSELRWMSS